jgi:hypothetical protein
MKKEDVGQERSVVHHSFRSISKLVESFICGCKNYAAEKPCNAVEA